jgi:hypothetical protein
VNTEHHTNSGDLVQICRLNDYFIRLAVLPRRLQYAMLPHLAKQTGVTMYVYERLWLPIRVEHDAHTSDM